MLPRIDLTAYDDSTTFNFLVLFARYSLKSSSKNHSMLHVSLISSIIELESKNMLLVILLVSKLDSDAEINMLMTNPATAMFCVNKESEMMK